MLGDSETRIPEHLTRPAHWPEFKFPEEADESDPTAAPIPEPITETTSPAPDTPPNPPLGDTVDLSDNRLTLHPHPLPPRDELEQIFTDLAADLADLKVAGNFANLSTLLHWTFERFAAICQTPYANLDQIRFGVQSKALRLQFDANRSELDAHAPDKSAALDAALLSAELIAARLPDWLAFLAETAPDRPAMEEHHEEVLEELEDAAEQIEQDPAHFDPSLLQRLREYIDTKTFDGYFAAVGLLNNMAYTAFKGLRRAAKGIASEGEKLAYKGITIAISVQIGGTLAKIAGILPAELEWIIPWLRYVEALLK